MVLIIAWPFALRSIKQNECIINEQAKRALFYPRVEMICFYLWLKLWFENKLTTTQSLKVVWFTITWRIGVKFCPPVEASFLQIWFIFVSLERYHNPLIFYRLRFFFLCYLIQCSKSFVVVIIWTKSLIEYHHFLEVFSYIND